jgi:hypothetical protein
MRVSENCVVNLKNKSHSATAEVTVPESGAAGVIVTQGGSVGGWSLYVHEGRLKYCYNFFGIEYYIVSADEPIPAATKGRRGQAFPDAARARTALLEADETWSRRGSRPKDAERLADPEIRVLRNGRPLAKGVPAAAEAMAASTREPGGTGLVAVATSLDFGFTRGLRLESARGGATRVHYVRVWATDAEGRWRVLADVETLEPAGGT